MKKIDLHIHTIATISDSAFIFDLDVFRRYVSEAKLDAVAVTNHDVFDKNQFIKIRDALDAVVFPGIEVNLERGHILVISDGVDLDDFDAKTNLVSQRINNIGESISVSEFKSIFCDLESYLIIPHYDKNPPITGETLGAIIQYISAGEVDSAKKFIRATKSQEKITPVLFSDLRIREGLAQLPTRQTYVDCGELSLDSIKLCLQDKNKVKLSEHDGNKLWQVLNDGQKISTGLNILLGERSSGKTYTLNDIYNSINTDDGSGVKYIRQFELVQQDDAAYEREFKNVVQREKSCIIDDYLSGFKKVLDDVMNIDLESNDNEVDKYLSSLLKSAEESDLRDVYSKMSLFNEVGFPISQPETLRDLIGSVRQVIENIEYKEIVEKHLDMSLLKNLACELIELLWAKSLEAKKKKFVNELVKNIKQLLKLETSATQVESVDLYKVAMDKQRIEKFEEIIGFLKTEAVVYEEEVPGFRIEAKQESFTGAGEIRAASGKSGSFKDIFAVYGDAYKYLKALRKNDSLSRSELYKLFLKISYTVLNKDGAEVSGGERSEFRLLQEIKDSQKYDILLIDEPESSFDNLFLKSNVNSILKKISETMPVVVVTHNSTVGASIGADYLLYTSKEYENGNIVHRRYSGYPTDKQLVSIDGKIISSHEKILNSLEAGEDEYNSRKKVYETIKD